MTEGSLSASGGRRAAGSNNRQASSLACRVKCDRQADRTRGELQRLAACGHGTRPPLTTASHHHNQAPAKHPLSASHVRLCFRPDPLSTALVPKCSMLLSANPSTSDQQATAIARGITARTPNYHPHRPGAPRLAPPIMTQEHTTGQYSGCTECMYVRTV
jgi:hypothetical protein